MVDARGRYVKSQPTIGLGLGLEIELKWLLSSLALNNNIKVIASSTIPPTLALRFSKRIDGIRGCCGTG